MRERYRIGKKRGGATMTHADEHLHGSIGHGHAEDKVRRAAATVVNQAKALIGELNSTHDQVEARILCTTQMSTIKQ